MSLATVLAAQAGASSAAENSKDLLIVGPGVLGGYAGKLWKELYPDCTVMGLTNTENSHASLLKLGLQPVTRSTLPARRFANVLYSAPPSGATDYPADVAAAAALWNGQGSLLFTSSFSVSAVQDGPAIESSPVVPLGASPSTDRLLQAEEAIMKAGGCVLRLVGLYHRDRGAHTFFLKMGTVNRPPNSVVNLIHYEDAASLATAIMRGDGSSDGPYRQRIFLGCDNHPVTFEEMMTACTSSGVFSGAVTFTAPPVTGGKRANNDATRAALGGWKPKYDSFAAFMAAGGKDVYADGMELVGAAHKA